MFYKIISHTRKFLKWYILLFLLLLTISLWFVILHEDRRGMLTVDFLNIGQGDSTFIESPTGVKVLIDGGPGHALLSEISHVLPWYDRKVDVLIVTNPDLDHYEGFISFLKNYSAEVFIEPGTVAGNSAYGVLQKEVEDKKITKITAVRGQKIDIGGGAYIEILFPDRDVSGLATNNGSIVAKLVYGKTSVMFEGDAPTSIEKYLLSLDPSLVDADILKAGHHGSRTSSSAEYVADVSPQYAIVSAGKENSYGHPHKEVLDTFRAGKVETLATCVMGRIVFHSDGNSFVLENKKITPVLAGCK